MAEEADQKKGAKVLKTILKVVIGLAFLALGVYLVIRWRRDLLVVAKGCVGLFLIMTGAITVAIAKE